MRWMWLPATYYEFQCCIVAINFQNRRCGLLRYAFSRHAMIHRRARHHCHRLECLRCLLRMYVLGRKCFLSIEPLPLTIIENIIKFIDAERSEKRDDLTRYLNNREIYFPVASVTI